MEQFFYLILMHFTLKYTYVLVFHLWFDEFQLVDSDFFVRQKKHVKITPVY